MFRRIWKVTLELSVIDSLYRAFVAEGALCMTGNAISVKCNVSYCSFVSFNGTIDNSK